MAAGIDGRDANDHVVDGHARQRGLGHRADGDLVLPVGRPCVPPEDSITRPRRLPAAHASCASYPDAPRVSRGTPSSSVTRGAERRERERRERRDIDPNVPSQVGRVHTIRCVVDRVLPRVVLPRLGDAYRREPLLVEWRVIATTPEPVGSPDQGHCMPGLITCGLPSHVARDLPREGESSGRFRKDADLCGVADTCAAAAATDDVVVEDGVDAPSFLPGTRRVESRADEPLLLAGERDENERRVEVDAAPASTRAASSTTVVPDPSSFAPGASLSARVQSKPDVPP